MKKLMVLILVVSLLQTFCLGIGFANENGENQESKSEELKSILEAVKAQLPISDEMGEFRSDYTEVNGNKYWNLFWYQNNYKETMDVNVDSSNKTVVSAYYYEEQNEGSYDGFPTYSEEQALDIASSFIKEVWGDKYGKLRLVEEDNPEIIFPEARKYPIEYNFNFVRIFEGIEVENQGIRLSINGENGEISNYQYNWNNSINIPSSSGKISVEEAKAIFKEKSGFELTYFMPNRGYSKNSSALKLVYRPMFTNNFAIDALSGEILDGDYFGFSTGYSADLSKEETSTNERVTLSEQELSELEKIKDILSAKEAQAKLEKLIAIPSGYNLENKNLSRYSPDLIIWSFNYQDPDNYQYIDVSIDAITGELIYLSKTEENFNENPVLTKEECQEKVLNAIKKYAGDKHNEVKLVNDMAFTNKNNLPYRYRFEFVRQANGIVYPENGFNVEISTYDGEINIYSMNWDNVTFPSIGQVKSVQDINNAFLEDNSLKLLYTENMFDKNVSQVYRLIYLNDLNQYSTMYDAKTGQLLDYNGNIMEEIPEVSFVDIDDHFAKDDILLLAKEGIIAGEGEYFDPNREISVAEFVTMLVKSQDRYFEATPKENAPWYEPYMKKALVLGILEEDNNLNPEAPLTKIEAAKMLINIKGYQKIAQASEIFSSELPEVEGIPEIYRGYVAIVTALSLMPVSSEGYFIFQGTITRGESASIVVSLLML